MLSVTGPEQDVSCSVVMHIVVPLLQTGPVRVSSANEQQNAALTYSTYSVVLK